MRRVLLFLALFALMALPASGQGGEHRAALVVRYPDGNVQTRCVAFAEPSISGQEVLVRSGLKAVINPIGSVGGAVCSIDGAGCSYPAQDCFCRCMGTQCEYWAYYHWIDGAWQYSQVGAVGSQVSDGAIEGWSWGPGNFSSGTEPPKVSFADVCRTVTAGGQGSTGLAPGALLQYAGFGAALVVLLLVGLLVLRRRA